MPNFIVSPNMSLPIPVVGIDPGPDYAINVNSSLLTLDGHSHTPGSGVAITPAALDINSDLPLNDNNAISARSVRYVDQLTPFSLPADIRSTYVVGADLYYSDGSGNQVRLTNSGSVAGPFGTITGLPSGTASASYAAGTFVFQAATNVGANIDGGSFIFRNSSVNSFGLTLQPPGSMAADYTVTLPPPNALGQTGVLTYDTSNNIGSITFDQVGQGMTVVGADAVAQSMDATGTGFIASTMSPTSSDVIAVKITATGANSIAGTFNAIPSAQADIVAGAMSQTGANAVIGKSSRPFASPSGGLSDIVSSGTIPSSNTTSSTYVTLAGSGLVITNSGRPIQLMLTASPNQGPSGIGGVAGVIRIHNDTTGDSFEFIVVPNSQTIPASFVCIDAGVGVGTYSYSVSAKQTNTAVTTTALALYAYEIH